MSSHALVFHFYILAQFYHNTFYVIYIKSILARKVSFITLAFVYQTILKLIDFSERKIMIVIKSIGQFNAAN